MYVLDDNLILSPSDLNGFVECRHLTKLDLAYAYGDREHEPGRDPLADFLARKGVEHERAYLESLRAAGHEIVEIPDPPDRSLAALRDAADATAEAMRAGAAVIYQATFFQPPMRGHADFLFRVERPSDLGEWIYEVADTKLARRAKPYFLLQLCFYSELLGAVQGGDPPEHLHVVLGTNEQQTYRLAEFSAYFRRVRERFLAALTDGAETYPEPCAHCAVCRWQERCDQRRADDDHLSLVANLTRRHRDLLNGAGITTLEALGRLDPEAEVPDLRTEQLGKAREQAALQLETRASGDGPPALALLPPADGRGFARLPEPSPGDVFFDMEGDPFFEGGLEYLFGFVTAEGAEPEFTALWGRDRGEEKRAFEQFIDFVAERRRAHPDLHVYHYAHYEVTALKRLAGLHGTREEELDEFLRDRVFVDLYKVVREGMRIGQPSYGLKKVEAFYMDQRDTAVTDGNASVIEFERWLEEGDASILEALANYNRDDCLSTLRLRDWLLDQRERAATEHGVELGWFEPEAAERSEEALAVADETAALIERLMDGVPDDLTEADETQRARWLLAQLLEYHRREARPVWWAFFERLDSEPDDLVDDAECIGALSPAPDREPVPDKQSVIHHLRFPPQETKLGIGTQTIDPATARNAGKIVAIDREHGTLELRRGPSLAGTPLPRALLPKGPYNTEEQKRALRRLANAVLEQGLDAPGPYRACVDLLTGRPTRVAGVASGDPLYEASIELDRLREIASGLENSYLVIQGPPGSGKTWSGARLITHLIGEGNRVGVTSTSHKAIHNMLDEVEEVAAEEGLDFRGLKKSSGNPDSEYASDHIECVDDNAALTAPDVQLPAGTAWHFCRPEADGTLDYLFIDEAGQVSLAEALALGTAARNIVLLGDPQQLPQISQAAHPPGCSLSALEHVLEGRQTIPPTEGVFLDLTYRLHPDVCAFCSELMYDSRLQSAPGRERQRIIAADSMLNGTGLRWIPVEHAGNSQSSPEEATAIADLIASLADARYIDCDGAEHPLTAQDVMVVTPYNAQVKCLEDRLPAGTRVGTVDKFQGQQTQIVLFSLATSSNDQIPRNLEFLLSRNRLNVAISRARCAAAVVASPELLEIDCRSIEQMRLVNALCRVAEVGGGQRDLQRRA